MQIPVACIDDPRLDDYRNIPDPDLLRSRGIFIAEGRHVVRRLQTSRFRTRSILVTAAAYDAIRDVVEQASDVPAFVVSQDVMNAVTGFNIHRGCLAAGERPAAERWQDLVRSASLVVVLERVSNADNVGAIFRNAAAFGAGTVLLGPACADPLYRKAIRTSMGAALHVPFAALSEWPADLEDLKKGGFTVIGLTPASDAIPLPSRERLMRPSIVAQPFRAAIVVGHEGDGLSSEALAIADVRVRIPMAGGVDSLNVATAAAIALYELSRA